MMAANPLLEIYDFLQKRYYQRLVAELLSFERLDRLAGMGFGL